MKLKHIYGIVVLFTSWIATAQTFQDNVNNETIGDFPSQWDIVGGMATVNQQDGYKYIGFRSGGIIKPIINGQTNNYLNGDFTVEFDVFFDTTSSLYGQRFQLRLWDGAYGYQKDGIRYKPFAIYRDGLETDWNLPEMGSAKNHLKEFQTLDRVWRHVKVEVKEGKLKILMDDKLILFLPRFKMQPTMLSIGGSVNDSQFDANIGFTNFVINTSDNSGTVDQIKFNRNISGEAHQKMEELLPLGIQSFSFTPSGGWIIITKNNGYFARGIPQQCFDKIGEYHNSGTKIKEVVFPPNGGDNSWLIITEKGTYAKNIPQECYERIQALKQQGKTIESVSFPYVNIYNRESSNSWVILTTDGNSFAKNIPDECYQIMRNIRQTDMPNKPSDRKITKVSFTPSGGWVVFAEDYFFTRNIPDEAFNKLREFRGNEYNNSILAFDPDNNGWSLVADKRTKPIPSNKIREFEQNVDGQSIWSLMRQRGVPGVAVAVVINGKIAWATGYGHLIENNPHLAVHPNSMFQAASISKVFAALGAFKLIDDGKITLNENLMTSGKLKVNLPFNECVKNKSWTQNFNKLTIENILQHRSGIEGRGAKFKSDCSFDDDDVGGGYGGYKDLHSLPTINDLLRDVTINYDYTVNPTPNNLNSWYSGKAFTVLQKLTEDITKVSYPEWMQQNILLPLGMNNSGFVINPENKYGEFSRGHDSNGNAFDVRRYPQYAAAGLYTNVEELANMIIMINDFGMFNNQKILSNLSMTSLLNNHMGIRVSSDKKRFSHGGVNTGFKAFFIGLRGINQTDIQTAGIVVLTNGDDRYVDNNDDGENDLVEIRQIITNRIIAIYGW